MIRRYPPTRKVRARAGAARAGRWRTVALRPSSRRPGEGSRRPRTTAAGGKPPKGRSEVPYVLLAVSRRRGSAGRRAGRKLPLCQQTANNGPPGVGACNMRHAHVFHTNWAIVSSRNGCNQAQPGARLVGRQDGVAVHRAPVCVPDSHCVKMKSDRSCVARLLTRPSRCL
jgi:hypothetical protein